MDTLAHTTTSVQTAHDWYTLISVAISPVIAVLVTRYLQLRKEKKDTQLRLFGILVARRGAIPVDKDFVDALNLIDIAFADEPGVRKTWDTYYSTLSNHGLSSEERNRKLNELLYAIGACLGFEVKGETIEKYYVPQGHVDANVEWVELRTELLRVLKNTKSLNIR